MRSENDRPTEPVSPFAAFALDVHPQGPLRAAITRAYRAPEPECVASLLDAARLSTPQAEAAHALAFRLAANLRAQGAGSGREGLVQGLLQEFALSSPEGIALMCLAEALLRIPDLATRDALIRDKVSRGRWREHVGQSASLFVNAAAWGLLLTGRLVSTHNEAGLANALTRLIARSGEPIVRRGVDLAMRLMGEQFVAGETIGEALAKGRRREAQGFRHSYDMLGEAAMTDEDAKRYLAAYEHAIDAIGRAAAGRGVYDGAGISIKLSALHPRYVRSQHERVMAELYPRLAHLALLARRHDIGLNIDAEEAERLDLSLDLLERLCFEPGLEAWNGVGFVVQAYQKRCPSVVDFLVDLAQRSRRRLMMRLVKGAYWDSEIKRAQVDGLEGYPVYTRKAHTDLSYIACARKLLAAPSHVYPQFATHNAYTLAAVYEIADPQRFVPGQYEFQCLHGMGEPLYEQVIAAPSAGGLGRPCRIYAPVGTHETLLAYLVRRLLENGANTSFVNRIADPSIPIGELIADPRALVETEAAKSGVLGAPHPRIPLPRALFGDVRANSSGVDLSSETRLASLARVLETPATWRAGPTFATGARTPIAIRNPADRDDVVGEVVEAGDRDIEVALERAASACAAWSSEPPEARVAMLERAADAMESELERLVALIVREAGKTYANAIGEVREAVDFLRYYAVQARALAGTRNEPLGVVASISPWNFPVSIFMGQVAAALAAGNAVLAKPAEQTPLVAAQAVRLLHAAGVPQEIVQLLPGRGETVGAALVADARVRGVLFTGSNEVARHIANALAARVDANGRLPVLVAETGGQNAMIVDSSALAEQVVADALASAFDSTGQRCSALRLLCVQDDVGDRIVTMLRGAMSELRMGSTVRLATDVGPVIDDDARTAIERHVDAMRAAGRRVDRLAWNLSDASLANGCFVPPTLIELARIGELTREVFGPVLHVYRYRRDELPQVIDAINATGYGLTLGVQSRIDETIDLVASRARAGNVYVNRNMIGAVVGVQPFGGEGLSGTGPKAGGPLYLHRLLARGDVGPLAYADVERVTGPVIGVDPQRLAPLRALHAWLASNANEALAQVCEALLARSPAGQTRLLAGPTGERNTYTLLPRRDVLCIAPTADALLAALAVVLAAGSVAIWPRRVGAQALAATLPPEVRARIVLRDDDVDVDAALVTGDRDEIARIAQAFAQRPGPIVGLQSRLHDASPPDAFVVERLLVERSLSINTAAAGGNASLMSVG
jgi:RHH-type proline utilization regulon transcriptional repressor/proline dehydrogenase/delta 1-pyrroline-5-carboxylate dehydrogenase